jgi:hypothetical protein
MAVSTHDPTLRAVARSSGCGCSVGSSSSCVAEDAGGVVPLLQRPLEPTIHPASSGSQRWLWVQGRPSGVRCVEVGWVVSGDVAGKRG